LIKNAKSNAQMANTNQRMMMSAENAHVNVKLVIITETALPAMNTSNLRTEDV